MVDKVDPVEARLEALEFRVISLSITQVLVSSMAGVILGSVDAGARRAAMRSLRKIVAAKMPWTPPIEEADLKIQEEASRMLDEIEQLRTIIDRPSADVNTDF